MKKIVILITVTTVITSLYSCGPRRYKCGPYRRCEINKKATDFDVPRAFQQDYTV